jgi:hypothetical protein
MAPTPAVRFTMPFARLVKLATLSAALLAALALPTMSNARILAPWGSTLSGTPMLDTANGASHATGGRSTERALSTSPHDGADFTLWNTRVPRSSATAPRGGQVLAVRIKGCARKDLSAPSQLSVGTPVNTINFQALARGPGGSYTSTATAPGFQLPFCSNSSDPARGAISTSTVTTLHPVHLCVARGETVGFYDIGGFIPNLRGPSWYSQGVPFEVIAQRNGAAMDSFADADISNGVYAPGARPRGANSGWGQESGEELMLQVIEGVGPDAYGLCPGGTAAEPSNSNAIVCVARAPFGHHRSCGVAADRVRPRLPGS